MKFSFRKPSRRTLFEIGLAAAVAYGGLYVYLRWGGEIVRHENRSESCGVTVQARPGEWDEIALSLAENTPRVGWALGLSTRLYQSKVEVWNLLFFPLRKAEELFWNLMPQRKT